MIDKFKEDNLFEYYKADYRGLAIHFRRCKATDVIEMLLDDNFARANGYEGFKQMLESLFNVSLSDEVCSRWLNKWAEVKDDGDVVMRGAVEALCGYTEPVNGDALPS